jgi:hypothetical protein
VAGQAVRNHAGFTRPTRLQLADDGRRGAEPSPRGPKAIRHGWTASIVVECHKHKTPPKRQGFVFVHQAMRNRAGFTRPTGPQGSGEPADNGSAHRGAAAEQPKSDPPWLDDSVVTGCHEHKTPPIRAGFCGPVRRCVTARVEPALQGYPPSRS